MFRNYHPKQIYFDEKGTCKVSNFTQANLFKENEKRKTMVDFPEYFSPE